MTEHEWLTSDYPGTMLAFALHDQAYGSPLGFRVSDRKLRFIACAYVRQMWSLLTDKRSRMAVEVAERYADGEATSEERGKAFNVADNLRGFQRDAAYACLRADAVRCVPEALDAIGDLDRRDRAKQTALIRDIVGNPWRPVMRVGRDWGAFMHHDMHLLVYECWFAPQVLSLAAAAYEDRPGQRCNAGCIKLHDSDEFVCYDNAGPDSGWFKCEKCHGDGRVHDGALDNVRLMVLADALEEAGCDSADLLGHLRSPGPHVRGCFVLDLILGKE